MVLVRLAGVGHRFGNLEVLADIAFDVRQGEVFGLLGPNGAGKTTTLRILCGLLQPDRGEVWIDGIDVRVQPLEARRRFAYVPDGAPLYANLSPRQHLRLVGRLHGLSEARVAEQSDHLLDVLELGERGNDPVGEFSRGMRQKTALACAILPQPPLLILDEPLTGLDAPTTAMFKEVLRAWADRGGAVLYTSHLLDVAERVCDRMAIVSAGRIVGLGTLDDLRTLAGRGTTLEQVFGALTRSTDPRLEARRLIGEVPARS